MTITLIESSIKDNSTPYRDIFRSLGLGTPAALHHLFTVVNGNLRREQLKDNPDADPVLAGFPVEALYEGDEAPNTLPLGRLILGDDTIAAYDTGYNVWIAFKDAPDFIIVYNVGGLFLDLIDEFRVKMARTVAPTGNTTFGMARAGCMVSLASLLGMGYTVAPSPEGDITISNRTGTTVSLDVQKLSNLLANLFQWDRGNATDPERVFEILRKFSSSNSNEVIQ